MTFIEATLHVFLESVDPALVLGLGFAMAWPLTLFLLAAGDAIDRIHRRLKEAT